ncbi:MAG: thiamine-phosphate kinase, partial [Mariprofundus sp.]|nr:thiamine-phosphate kinase [Mariprofundus sp.]
GIGDDASIHRMQTDMELVVSTDSSVQGVHWPDDFPLDKAADRAVCAALSDLAAMGAEAVCAWLNVMAENSHAVESLGAGSTRALKRYDVELAGGDTCRSATNALSVTVAGQLPQGRAMRRDAAVSSDYIWLVGRVGVHSLGLQQWISGQKDGAFVTCFETVVPQLEAGVAVRKAGVSCCIDISDGLLQDAGHIAAASGTGMDIEMTSLPDWDELSQAVGEQSALQLIAHGGEDYALLFTAPADIQLSDIPAVRIGRCRKGEGVRLLLNGEKTDVHKTGFDHFA